MVTLFQIVMEYCGAGSVSDIMRIIERPVGVVSPIQAMHSSRVAFY